MIPILAVIIILLLIVIYESNKQVIITVPRKLFYNSRLSISNQIDDLLMQSASNDFDVNTNLGAACIYSVLGGKHLRGLILWTIASAKDPLIDPAEAITAIEYLHSASLIIDDLPQFDNDVIRRGKPAVFVIFGEATAQMAAMSLVSAALYNICRQVDNMKNSWQWTRPDTLGAVILKYICKCLGANGAAGGQYMDTYGPIGLVHESTHASSGIVSNASYTLAENMIFKEFGSDAVTDLLEKKTSTFFELTTVIGWLIGGGTTEKLDDVAKLGQHLGTAFQLADDIGDMAQDAAKNKWNFANVYGIDAAQYELLLHLQAMNEYIRILELNSPNWSYVAECVKKMLIA